MDPKSAAQVIRDTVTMEQVVSLYGYKVKRGFMVCPFHGDTDASLKVYRGTGGWHCFGCGKGGSVVDFVMEQEGCDFRTAVAALDKAFRLGLSDPKENAMKADENRELQAWLDRFAEAVYGYIDAIKIKIQAEMRLDIARMKELEMLKQVDPEKLTAHDYDFLNQWKDGAQYDEYRLEKLDEFQEEVAAWRRKARRVRSA